MAASPGVWVANPPRPAGNLNTGFSVIDRVLAGYLSSVVGAVSLPNGTACYSGFVAPVDLHATHLSIYTSTGDAAVNVGYLGLYAIDQAGNGVLLAVTANTPAIGTVEGRHIVPLIKPVTLTGGVMYMAAALVANGNPSVYGAAFADTFLSPDVGTVMPPMFATIGNIGPSVSSLPLTFNAATLEFPSPFGQAGGPLYMEILA